MAEKGNAGPQIPRYLKETNDSAQNISQKLARFRYDVS